MALLANKTGARAADCPASILSKSDSAEEMRNRVALAFIGTAFLSRKNVTGCVIGLHEGCQCHEKQKVVTHLKP
jgi:hypothetical protein